uniref:ANK_REP_REGION domain-containing protein n=1 Tax=Macrostomum lignano TaxID=282301 RepID=A0A1I8H584_9PLAT
MSDLPASMTIGAALDLFKSGGRMAVQAALNQQQLEVGVIEAAIAPKQTEATWPLYKYLDFLDSPFEPPAQHDHGIVVSDAEPTGPGSIADPSTSTPVKPLTSRKRHATGQSISMEEISGIQAAAAELQDQLNKLTTYVECLEAKVALKDAEVEKLRRQLRCQPPTRVWSQCVRRYQKRLKLVQASTASAAAATASRDDSNSTRIDLLSKSLRAQNCRLQDQRKLLLRRTPDLTKARETIASLQRETMETCPERGGLQFTRPVIETCVRLVLDCHVPVQLLRLPSTTLVTTLAYSIGSSLAKAAALEKILKAVDDDQCYFQEGSPLCRVDTGNGCQVTLSLREMEGGTTQMYAREMDSSMDELIDAFVSLISQEASDWTDAEREQEHRRLKASVLLRIKFMMTDCHVVNRSLRLLLDEIREPLAQNLGMSAPSPVIALYCGMHLIVNLAAVAESALRDFEKSVASGPVGAAALGAFRPSKAESGTQRLICTACKALHPLGDKQAGVASQFATFVRSEMDGGQFRMEDFRVNADVNARSTAAVRVPRTWADRLPLCPAAVSIIDMNKHYETACQWLRSVATSAFVVSSSSTGPFPDIMESILKDQEARTVWESLTTDEVTITDNALVTLAVQTICASMVVLAEREVRDHLPGGQLCQLSAEDLQHAAGAPKDNVPGERVFGILDKGVRDKPNMRPLACEVLVLFGQNA